MAATIEVKYFNSYWLKKMKSIQPVRAHTTTEANAYFQYFFETGNSYFIISLVTSPTSSDWWINNLGAGQKLTYSLDGVLYSYIITGWEDISTGPPGITFKIYLNKPIDSISFIMPSTPFIPISFSQISDFNYVPGAAKYIENDAEDWFIEESRIAGGYNNTSTDLGIRAFIVEDTPDSQNRVSSLIYSGIFNSRTGINNTNQFSVAEDITRTIDPSQGSIQKLYAEDTNLIIFQEAKVSRALIDKSAVYSAEGSPLTTSSLEVIGQVQGYAGNYGIGTDPESFAVYGYRKYFVDRPKNTVLRLSQDGITEISAYGMLDYFRDTLGGLDANGVIVGSWDMHNKQYVLSIQNAFYAGERRPIVGVEKDIEEYYQTLAFDEDSLGWTSLFSFKPDVGFSILNNYYTASDGNIWKHYSINAPYANFYGVQYLSTVTFVMNPEPSYSKTFQTINYEGSPGWALTAVATDSNIGVPISSASASSNLSILENQLFLNNFKVKENKYFGTLINNTIPTEGTVVYGQSMSGLAGFYAIGTFTFPDLTNPGVAFTSPSTLFAVSSTFAQSLSN
jgi:hypothetical protein